MTVTLVTLVNFFCVSRGLGPGVIVLLLHDDMRRTMLGEVVDEPLEHGTMATCSEGGLKPSSGLFS